MDLCQELVALNVRLRPLVVISCLSFLDEFKYLIFSVIVFLYCFKMYFLWAIETFVDNYFRF